MPAPHPPQANVKHDAIELRDQPVGAGIKAGVLVQKRCPVRPVLGTRGLVGEQAEGTAVVPARHQVAQRGRHRHGIGPQAGAQPTHEVLEKGVIQRLVYARRPARKLQGRAVQQPFPVAHVRAQGEHQPLLGKRPAHQLRISEAHARGQFGRAHGRHFQNLNHYLRKVPVEGFAGLPYFSRAHFRERLAQVLLHHPPAVAHHVGQQEVYSFAQPIQHRQGQAR